MVDSLLQSAIQWLLVPRLGILDIHASVPMVCPAFAAYKSGTLDQQKKGQQLGKNNLTYLTARAHMEWIFQCPQGKNIFPGQPPNLCSHRCCWHFLACRLATADIGWELCLSSYYNKDCVTLLCCCLETGTLTPQSDNINTRLHSPLGPQSLAASRQWLQIPRSQLDNKTIQDTTGWDKTRQDTRRQDKTPRDRTRQDKTRQHKISKYI